MDYSVVIPVFDREDVTENCLATLLPTLEGAGRGEIIVVDNGSGPATSAVLSKHPWVRVIRNEENRGFAAACNQGARSAGGTYLCLLNNDTIAQPRWLANMISQLVPGVGVVGARLLFADDTIQHAGVAVAPARFGPEGIRPYHIFSGLALEAPGTNAPDDFQIVTGACLLTPRELFSELNGFDETYWNGCEDADYCLRVAARGLRIVYEPSATLYHLESQSGFERKRRVLHNLQLFGRRWGSRALPDQNRYWARLGFIERESLTDGRQSVAVIRLPPAVVIVHGQAPSDVDAFAGSLRDNRIRVENVMWLAAGDAPRDCTPALAGESAIAALRALLDERSDRYLAFVDTATRLSGGWLDELVNASEYGSEVVAATVVSDESAPLLQPCAADARCSLLNLRSLPLHIRFGEVDTIDGAIVDLTWQAVGLGLGVRAIDLPGTRLGPAKVDPAFRTRHLLAHDMLRRAERDRMESACEDQAPAPTLASIVMLSWNAPDYTKTAVESIRAVTRLPYEIIIVDNGSGPETLAMLAQLENVSIVYNSANTGFAHGCNQGIAVARGTHIVLLNNDVVVTEGWLDGLLDAHRRDPLVGVSAPRSNRIAGHQQVNPLSYDSMEAMHRYAASRARDYAGVHYRTNRAIGFCLCIARTVIDEIGGFDPRYGLGNFEDDDFCIRVLAAGYQIVICEDVFIHHFGSVSFTVNQIDQEAKKEENWGIFAARWGLPMTRSERSYESAAAVARGFVRARDYVVLPPIPPAFEAAGEVRPERSYETAFVAIVDSEPSWARLGPIVTNYIKALSVDDSALFAIAVTGQADLASIGGRIGRSIDRLKLDEQRVADIDVACVAGCELANWVAAIPANSRLRVTQDDRLSHLALTSDRSPSGLQRTVRGKA